MKSVLISIHPKRCDLIASGRETIEAQKTCPKIETPFKCYIYETKARSDMPTFVDEDGHVIYTGRGQVIGEFVCDNVEVLFDTNGNPENYMTDILPSILQKTALSYDEFGAYVGSRADKNSIYGWHISELKIYDKPRELSDFKTSPCEKSEKSCGKCKYLVKIDTPDMHEVDCFVKNGREITCPPQSWMYVEVYK